jgi:hypothetical protein
MVVTRYKKPSKKVAIAVRQRLDLTRQHLHIIDHLRVIGMLFQLGICLLHQIFPCHARIDKFEILEEIRDQGPVLAIVDIGVGLHLLGVKPVIEAFVSFEFLKLVHGDHWDRVNFQVK